MLAFRDFCISSSYHRGSINYVEELSSITYFCEEGNATRWYSWAWRVLTEKKWEGFTYKKVSPNDEDYDTSKTYGAWDYNNLQYHYIHNFMSEEDFIENYKPYTLYIESDDGINEYIATEYEYDYYNIPMKRLDLIRTSV